MEHQFAVNGGMERETKHTFIKADYLEDRLLTPRQTAAYLCSSVSALSQYRALGIGPAYHKIGKMVRYRISDINKWLEEKRSRKN